MGFTGYYRSFIKEYAHLTAEMNKNKMMKEVPWDDNTQAKFKALKECFKAQPVRGYPQYHNPEPFILDTDYSSSNMAAVLSQKQDGHEVFLGCAAKKCGTAESNYPPHKGELAAVILGLKKFEHILRARQFVIRTDSKCVEFVNTMKEYRGIYARWNCFLSSFNYKLIHRAGKLNQNADPLSRRPGLPAEPEEEDPTAYLHDVADIYAVHDEEIPEETGYDDNQPDTTNDGNQPSADNGVRGDDPVKGSGADQEGTPALTIEEVAQHTAQDTVLTAILQAVRAGKRPDKQDRKGLTAEGVSYVNVFEQLHEKPDQPGVLWYEPPKINGQTSTWLMCLPVTLQNTAFDGCHERPENGHFGIINTARKMQERFYFPHMYAFITARINNCLPCIQKKLKPGKKTHKMHREELSYFGQRVYIDVVGQLVQSTYKKYSYRNFLTMQDGFTRYLVAVPIVDTTTATIVDAIIEHWIYKFGCMEVIHSDRGSSFSSDLFHAVMGKLGVVKTVTPPYSPEGDRVERAHRVLGNILRADQSQDAERWAAKLPAAVMAYNGSFNRVIGVSPYEAVYFRKIQLPEYLTTKR